VEICPSSNASTTGKGVVAFLDQLVEFHKRNHHMIICVDDSLLFGTNISNEYFEYAKACKLEPRDLKRQLLRNVDAIFDENSKEWLRTIIENYRI